MHIEVICTGDEVLTGKIVNTNFSYISQKLEDVGLSVQWGTTVGDDRESLLRGLPARGRARRRGHRQRRARPHRGRSVAGDRGKAAGVELVLNEEWLATMEDFFQRRSRVMPPNNRKQAMLPDHRRGDRQPDRHRLRLRARHRPGALLLHARRAARAPPHAGGAGRSRGCSRKAALPAAIFLKRFHSYGLGESHVRLRCSPAWRTLVPDGSVKLGFRAHYPQLETKLTVRGARHGRHPAQARAGASARCASASATSSWARTTRRSRASSWRSCQRQAARSRWSRRSRAGRSPRASRHLPGAEQVFRRGVVVARPRRRCAAAVGLAGAAPDGALTPQVAEAVARAARSQTGATHALAVLIDLDEGADRIEFGGTICLAIATAARRGLARRPASSAGATGCGWARSRWGSTACAATCRGCRCTSGSTSRRRRRHLP